MKHAKRNKKINYGSVELGPEYMDANNQKFRVNFWMDGDLKQELMKQASEVGAGYQTYMHKLLRDAVFKNKSLAERVAALEKVIKKKA